jgi:hypothetical protein
MNKAGPHFDGKSYAQDSILVSWLEHIPFILDATAWVNIWYPVFQCEVLT